MHLCWSPSSCTRAVLVPCCSSLIDITCRSLVSSSRGCSAGQKYCSVYWRLRRTQAKVNSVFFERSKNCSVEYLLCCQLRLTFFTVPASDLSAAVYWFHAAKPEVSRQLQPSARPLLITIGPNTCLCDIGRFHWPSRSNKLKGWIRLCYGFHFHYFACWFDCRQIACLFEYKIVYLCLFFFTGMFGGTGTHSKIHCPNSKLCFLNDLIFFFNFKTLICYISCIRLQTRITTFFFFYFCDLIS